MRYRLKFIRNKLKLTQTEFGERLGVSRNVINNLESGRVEMKELFINHLCSVFKINKEWLLTGSGDMFLIIDNDSELESIMQKILNENDEFMKDIIFAFYSLTTEERKAILTIINRFISFQKE